MRKNYDTVIVGSGVAGLYTALHLDPAQKVLLLCKQQLMLSNSSLAQGGIAAVFDKQNDNIESHIQDTLVAGGNCNNKQAVRMLTAKGPQEVQTLIDYGVEFDKDENGNVHLTLEGGHSRHRILHHADSTGREMVEKLLKQVQKLPNVEVLDETLVCDVRQSGGGFAIDTLKEGAHTVYGARYLVLATGGIGRVFEYTTNSKIATGDGIALAYHMGAKIKNISRVQFHPTAFANHHTRECFLISEAVRGEGAYLLNHNLERFMHHYDARLELAPRDVVSRAIITEAHKTGSEAFYLDIRHQGSAFIKKRFPMIYENLLQQGFDLTKDLIPIFPCQHYLMGGIDVNLHAQTTIENLYAVGECSHTGVHGNNRLASNSLLEAVVFAKQAAEDINRKFTTDAGNPVECDLTVRTGSVPLPKGIRTEVRHIMQQSHFVIPNREEAVAGLARLKQLIQFVYDTDFVVDIDTVEARSLVTVAYLILKEQLEGSL